jgi:hypothetical protein
MDSHDLRAALERTLTEIDADDRLGPLLGACALRMRFVFTDLDTILDVATGDGDTNLVWSFDDDASWVPKLTLWMTSDVANRYLQGRESLAIAMARGQVRWRGDSRTALLYLPAARLIAEPYRRVVEADYPALAA